MEGTTSRIQRNPVQLYSQSVAESSLSDGTEDIQSVFWQEWQEYRDHLYHCCLKWMNGNETDAEDALSRAMIKALEKVREGKYVINNFKAWLTRLTRNLCVDIHRECNRGIRRIESIEAIAEEDGEKLASSDETPVNAATRREIDFVLGNAIDELPPRLREVFILYFHEEQSYREIAQQIGISYDNVCKRISQARAILRKELSGYVAQEDLPSKRGNSENYNLQKPVERDILPSVGELEEVSLVACEIPEDAGLFVPQIETVIDGAKFACEIPEDAGLSVPQVETVIDATESEEKIRENTVNYIPRELVTLGKETWVKRRIGGISANLPHLTNPHIVVQKILARFELSWRMWADSGGYLLFFL